MSQKFIKSLVFAGLYAFASLTFALMLTSCSSEPEKKNDIDQAETSYNTAQAFIKDDRYDEGIRRLQEIKNKFPYSKYATLAELAIADAYYAQESYPEAQVSYQNFKDLHPKHPQIDYVIDRLGLSYFKQLPPTPDRDLAVAANAIQNFDELTTRFPNSEHAAEARENKLATLKLLSDKEIYIADFYFKKQQYLSAVHRYEGDLRKYPGQLSEEHALARVVECYVKLENMDKARTILDELKQRFPNSSEISSAEKAVK